MALVVISDPLDVSSNAYASVATITTYAQDRVADPTVATNWVALTEAQKAMYAVNASVALDNAAEWIGEKYDADQILDWPRYDACVDGYYIDSTIYPIKLIEAACEMALWLMANSGQVPVSSGAVFDSIKIGPITVDYNEQSGVPSRQYFPDNVAALLRDLGTLSQPPVPGNMSVRNVRLQRA